MRRILVAAAALAVCLSLGSGSSPVFAHAPLAERPVRAHEPASKWDAVREAVRKLAALLKNGSGIDPFGRPDGAGTPPLPPGDNGSGIDPFGGR